MTDAQKLKAFQEMMKSFGVVTVMNACIYKLRDGYSYVGRGSCAHGEANSGALKPDNFVCTGLYLDTLKIANLTQEGPTKTITGGQYANPLLKYGKTMTCEMQDALGRAPVLTEFFGCDYDEDNGILDVTDKFPGAFAIEGDTFFIDQKTGEKVDAHIFIPQFLPDAILSLTQDAEGDAAVFDLNGTISVTHIWDGKDKDVFYQIRSSSWFAGKAQPMAKEDATTPVREDDYHDNDATSEYEPTLDDYKAYLDNYKAEQKAFVEKAAEIVGDTDVVYTDLDAITITTASEEAYNAAKEAVDAEVVKLITGLEKTEG